MKTLLANIRAAAEAILDPAEWRDGDVQSYPAAKARAILAMIDVHEAKWGDERLVSDLRAAGLFQLAEAYESYLARRAQRDDDSLVLAAAEWLIGAEGLARRMGYTNAVDLSDALKATQQSEPSDTARLDWLALGYDVYVFGGKSWDIVDDRQDVYVEVVRSAPSLRAAIDAAMAASAFAPQEGSDK